MSLSAEPQHIVSGGRSQKVQSDSVGCGAESHPWIVEALTGQRIAVSLIDIGIIHVTYSYIFFSACLYKERVMAASEILITYEHPCTRLQYVYLYLITPLSIPSCDNRTQKLVQEVCYFRACPE
jgi:hypothetical protein